MLKEHAHRPLAVCHDRQNQALRMSTTGAVRSSFTHRFICARVCRYGYGSPVVVQRGGDSGFGGVLLFLMAAGALVWFLQGSRTGDGLSLGARRASLVGGLQQMRLARACMRRLHMRLLDVHLQKAPDNITSARCTHCSRLVHIFNYNMLPRRARRATIGHDWRGGFCVSWLSPAWSLTIEMMCRRRRQQGRRGQGPGRPAGQRPVAAARPRAHRQARRHQLLGRPRLRVAGCVFAPVMSQPDPQLHCRAQTHRKRRRSCTEMWLPTAGQHTRWSCLLLARASE